MQSYGVPASTQGVLPWSWAEERLSASRGYWLTTVSSDSSPHSVPVWGVWLDGAFTFDTAPDAKKARNIDVNPRVVVATEATREAVILHGDATRVPPDEATDAAYEAKYGSRPPGVRYRVRPSHAFGFMEDEPRFAVTATRWQF